MNMVNSEQQEHDFDYRTDFGRRATKEKSSRSRKMHYGRSGRAAVSHNGIHRRRNKRFTW